VTLTNQRNAGGRPAEGIEEAMRYELLGHRVRVYAVSIALLGVLVSAAVWFRGDTSAVPTASTASNTSTAAVVLMVKDSPQGTVR
jgi:hypothetical protein